MKKNILILILTSLLVGNVAMANRKEGLSIGLSIQSNVDYDTIGVNMTGANTDYNGDSLMFAAMSLLQRLDYQDGDRSNNATFTIEGGMGFGLGEDRSLVIGALVRYIDDNLYTDTERLNGKDFYNREGLQPGIFATKYFGKYQETSFRLTFTHNGEDFEYSFDLNKELDF
ncbi:MAG: hypothetical protein HOO06_10765 [Bdellovibrionaceae bacterium]|jgi:hypothetical protein|nr:hypothetical protein [Pseudobdellovibrionaceae bacterium]